MSFTSPPPTRRLCWHFLLAIVGMTVGIYTDLSSLENRAFGADEPTTVQLTVDYGDGVLKQFTRLEWKEGMTVLAAVQQAAKHPRGIKPAVQGSGELTLLIAIDELKNEGNGKNWLYRVNGKLGDRSCGIMQLKAGDSVTWQFSEDMP